MTITRRNVLLGATAVAALAPIASRAQTSEVVIGVLYPLSGASAQQGVDAQKCVRVRRLKSSTRTTNLICRWRRAKACCRASAGPRTFSFIADHQGDPQKGRAEAERLITQDKVCAIVGTSRSSVAISSSARCCTTSARSASPTRSSTSPASWTAEEWEIVRAPPGRRAGDARPGRRRARRGGHASCAARHERWDGGGYPDGLVARRSRSPRASSARPTPSAR